MSLKWTNDKLKEKCELLTPTVKGSSSKHERRVVVNQYDIVVSEQQSAETLLFTWQWSLPR